MVRPIKTYPIVVNPKVKNHKHNKTTVTKAAVKAETITICPVKSTSFFTADFFVESADRCDFAIK